MHSAPKVTHAGATAHFDVSYVTRLGPKGASLATAILQNRERDYSTLKRAFGGITPQRLPFVVQITTDSTGASHSSCKGTDVSLGGKSAANVDLIRSFLVAEADEVSWRIPVTDGIAAPALAKAYRASSQTTSTKASSRRISFLPACG